MATFPAEALQVQQLCMVSFFIVTNIKWQQLPAPLHYLMVFMT